MITCTLNGKKYSVDFVSGRALREMEPAVKVYGKINQLARDAAAGKTVDSGDLSISSALDTMVQWFCLLFNNQFTPDDLYDYYPSDRLMHDVSLALIAVQQQMTSVLSDFPTTPTAGEPMTA